MTPKCIAHQMEEDHVHLCQLPAGHRERLHVCLFCGEAFRSVEPPGEVMFSVPPRLKFKRVGK